MEVKLYNPNIAQDRAHYIEEVLKPKMMILNWGRQTGKSMYLRMSTLMYAINNPRSKQMYVNLTWDTNSRVIRDIIDMFDGREELTSLFIKQIKTKEQEILFKNGSIIRFKSYEQADGLRGATLDRLVIDEAAFQDERIINEVLLPMLTTTGGICIMASTSNHVQWFRDLKKQGLDKDNHDHIITSQFTYKELENDTITSFVEDVLKRQLTKDQFNQEVLNMDVNSEALFHNVEEAMIDFTKEELKELGKKNLYLGIDVATSNDYTVITIGTKDYEVIKIDRFNMREDGLNAPEFKARILLEYRKYFPNIMAGYFEVNNNDLLFDEISDYKDTYKLYPFLTNATSKPKMIVHLMKLFEEGVIKIINNEQLTTELYGFERKLSPVSGRIIYANGKDGTHDDCVISLALYAYCVHNELDGGVTSFY